MEVDFFQRDNPFESLDKTVKAILCDSTAFKVEKSELLLNPQLLCKGHFEAF